MPKFNDPNMESHALTGAGHYGYSAVRPEELGASEYTLVTIVFDESGSTSYFAQEMNKCLAEIVKACSLSPRADNLLIRLVAFGSQMREVHGFKMLENCNVADYQDIYQSGGSTALFDSTVNSVDATRDYADKLTKSNFLVNAIVFVLTDGDDNVSKFTMNEVKNSLARCVQNESMESLVSILIGVNVQDSHLAQYLADFQKVAGFTQYVKLDDASEKTLAKLAAFVSKSISSQSQALGSQLPSQSLTF